MPDDPAAPDPDDRAFPDEPSPERQRIDAACRFLEAHLDDDPPLDDVARAAHYSPFHFHRLFRGLTGETVRGYSRRLRLERAAHRLQHGADEILTIALDSGYGSHEAFTRAFTKRFGITPSAYRTERDLARPPVDAPAHAPIDVRIEERAACVVAAARHVGPYADVGTAWKALMAWGWTKLIFGRAEMFGLCHDDPDVTDPQRVRYDACLVVKPTTRVRGAIVRHEFPGGTFAVAEHPGPYATIGETYARLFAQIVTAPIAGRRWSLGDPPSLEHYLNDPRKTAPEDLRTEIWMRVEPRRA